MAAARQGGQAGAPGELTTALPYTRVSKDEMAREGLSLPAQVDATRRYVVGRGFVLGPEFQDVMKGTRDDRPHYQALLEEARRLRAEGRAVVVVVCWLHRLGRRVAESVRCRAEFKALGVPIHSVQEGGEVSDFLANIMASVAQYEVEQLGERIQQVNGHTRQNGWRVPGRCPWGYAWRDATEAERAEHAPKRVLARDPATAPVAAEAFRRVAGGDSVRTTAEWAARLPSEARGGRVLTYQRIRLMLRSPLYIGMGEPDEEGVMHPGRWPALIDRATWDRVQARVAAHARTPRQASGKYLLTGVLFCPDPECGSRMAGRSGDGGPHGHGARARYTCIAKMLGASAKRPGCTQSAHMGAVDAAVLAQLGALLEAFPAADPELTRTVERALRALLVPTGAPDVRAQLRRQEAVVVQNRTRLAEAAVKLIDGDLDRAGYDAAKTLIERELAGAEAAAARLREAAGQTRPEPPTAAVLVAKFGGLRAAIAGGDTAELRDVLTFFVARVEPVRLARGTYGVRVGWTPEGEAAWALAGGRP